jgi:hypothetical protein
MLIDRKRYKMDGKQIEMYVGFNESNNTFKKNDDRHGYWKFNMSELSHRYTETNRIGTIKRLEYCLT